MQSSSRNGAKVIWLAIHTTEGIMRARDLLNWKEWAGSSHASNDETGVLLTPADGFVPYDRAAWTLRDGNPISENLEQCGWARWTRAEWLARPKLLETTALWLADRSRARGVPLRLLTPEQIRRREPGVLGHGHYSTATGDGTHWDPGPNYPWDVVLDRARQITSGATAPASSTGDDELNELQNAALWETLDRVKGITFPKPGTAHSDSHYMPADSLRLVDVANALPRLEAQLVAMNATVKGLVETIARLAQGDDIDEDALVERIGSRVDAAVSDHAKLVKVAVSIDDQNPA